MDEPWTNNNEAIHKHLDGKFLAVSLTDRYFAITSRVYPETLEKWPPPQRTIIAGDFNATHWTWQPGRNPDTAGRRLAEWVESHDLIPTLTDTPTRDSGKCIDLAFSNCAAESRVDQSLHTGLDHYTVCTLLPDPVRTTPGAGKKYVPLECWEDFSQLMRSFAWTLPTINTQEPSEANLDKGAEALPRSSSTDLVACLIHDIERALDRGLVASLLTLDISGAFDIVMRNRLVRRLREQGWPTLFVKWVESFMSDRSVLVRNGLGGLIPSLALECGAPQGSPISPIVSMLYFSPILKFNDPERRFGYADDVALVVFGDSTAETTKILQYDLDDTLRWGNTNAISFDPEKAELIHFFRTRGREHREHVTFEDKTISPQLNVRWLGIHLDSRLSFRKHVEAMASKALKAANFLRSLNQVQKGSPPDAVAKAAKACVTPVALFGAEAWWPGEERRSAANPNHLVSTGTAGLVERLDKVFRVAARTVIPAWKTTRTAILHRESGIPPASVALAQLRVRTSTRYNILHSAHPLAARIAKRPPRDLPPTRLQRTAAIPGKVPRPSLFVKNIGSVLPGPELRGQTKDKAAEKHLEFLTPSPDGDTGWGAVTFHDCVVTTDRGRLMNSEVYDAEAFGALIALEGSDIPTDHNLARINSSTARTVRRRRSNQVRFGAAEAPSNSVGLSRTVTPNMLAALSDELVVLHPINVDEIGCDKSIGIKNKGWPKKGITPVQIKRLHRSQRHQILPAYTQDGIICFEIFGGSTDGENFEFLARLLPYCGKWPESRSGLIIDNASIHRSERVQQLCEDGGVVLLCCTILT
ncbi:reverse transcriptase [Trichoderma arundinaceum]|uniref:Reverse transcriptase n=1 Tax=Trichoderma arundinaceum TaxID=490622 RepID=A0A395NQ56_TRIAR|nr:reverse transcriptase [Trichoderma arundinaceum]